MKSENRVRAQEDARTERQRRRERRKGVIDKKNKKAAERTTLHSSRFLQCILGGYSTVQPSSLFKSLSHRLSRWAQTLSSTSSYSPSASLSHNPPLPPQLVRARQPNAGAGESFCMCKCFHVSLQPLFPPSVKLKDYIKLLSQCFFF